MSDEDTYLNVYAFENSWQLYQYEWPQRAIAIDFINAVDGKLITTTPDALSLDIRDALNTDDPVDASHYEISQTHTGTDGKTTTSTYPIFMLV